jgi:hypothetical protein
MSKESPLLDYMKRKGIPPTRQNYLEINHMGKAPSQLSPELEAEMPERLQLPKEEEEAMPKAPMAKGAKAKPVADEAPMPQDIYIGGKGKDEKLAGQMDTDAPEPTPLSKGVTFHNENATKPTMDMSNPAMNQIEPDPDQPRLQ